MKTTSNKDPNEMMLEIRQGTWGGVENEMKNLGRKPRVCCDEFLSATEYHSDADYNSRWVGVVVVIVVDYNFKNGLTFERLDRFASYLGGSCTGVSCFTFYAYVMIQPPQKAQPAYQPKSEKHA